ncbi:hypothetical protein CRG98_001878 [Punica granatum]|uniref:Uncharacterized protein n=1 Tax=Punica granatum TaxID=22663 RepID=A0A2I0LAN5_PUNGR|nr:hypothetical protein CRG98_001878 [Punica granatum]
MWTFVGARMRAFASCGLGVSTFPGDAGWTSVRRSRRYLFTTRRSRASELPGSRSSDTPSFAKALICAEPESPSSGVHIMCGPISYTPFQYSSLLGLQFHLPCELGCARRTRFDTGNAVN